MKDNLLSYLFWLIAILVIAANLGGESLSILIFVLTASRIWGFVSSFGLEHANRFYASKHPDLRGSLVGNSFIISIIIGGIFSGGVLYLIFKFYMEIEIGISINHLIFIPVLIIPGILFCLTRGIIRGTEKKIFATLLPLIGNIAFMVIIIQTQTKHRLSIETTLALWVLTVSAISLGYAFYAWKSGGINLNYNLNLLSRSMGYSFRHYITRLIEILTELSGIIMIAIMLSLKDLAVFVIAYAFGEIIIRASKLVMETSGVKLIARKIKISEFLQKIRISFAISVIVSLLISQICWLIIVTFLDESFNVTLLIFFLMIPGWIAHSFSESIGSLIKLKQSRLQKILISPGFLVFILVFSYFAILKWGVYGFPIIFSLSHILKALTGFLLVNRNFHIKPRHLFWISFVDIRTLFNFNKKLLQSSG